MLNEFAEDTDQPLESLFCWAHGDGGPSEAPIGDGYGLYFISGDETKPSRLLRFDDKSTDFKTLNRNLWDLRFCIFICVLSRIYFLMLELVQPFFLTYARHGTAMSISILSPTHLVSTTTSRNLGLMMI